MNSGNEQQLSIIKKIEELINSGAVNEADIILSKYEHLIKKEKWLLTTKSILHILKGELDLAEEILKNGLIKYPFTADILFNLAYVYEQKKEFQSAYDYYLDAKFVLNKDEQETAIKLLNSLKKNYPKLVERQKIVFFVKPGLDNFIDNVISKFSNDYRTRKILVSSFEDIDKGMDWADICWFEWCDELVIYGSKKAKKINQKIICRLHSFEAFTAYINQVYWKNVDKVIFIAEHIKNYVLNQENDLTENQTVVIPNGIDLNKFKYKKRNRGFNIAFVGYINYKKGPQLLLQAFKEAYDFDNRYKLFIAGEFQDPRYKLYFRQMLDEWGMNNNVFFEGWQEDIDRWLEDKDYIISSSVLESQHLSIMEAMAKGIKPLIHNFVGAKKIYKEDYLWNTTQNLIELLETNYSSQDYHNFINNNYSLNSQYMKLKNTLSELTMGNRLDNHPLVTIGVINYNYGHYLEECMDSILNQTYKNLDILIIDDCSIDDSLEKIKKYEGINSSVRSIIHQKNVGHAIKSIQEIVENALGEYFLIISADDFFSDSRAIEKYVNVISVNPTLDYVYGNLRVVNKNKEIIDIWKYKEYSPKDVVKEIFNRGGSGIIPMTIGIYRTDFYRKNKLNWLHNKEDLVGADTYNSLVNTKRGWNIFHIDDALMSYRIHDNNMSIKDMDKRIKSLIITLEYIINNFEENIYLPEVNWGRLNEKEREAKKNLELGLFYFKWFNYYNTNGFSFAGNKIKIDEADKLKPLTPLLEQSKKYLSENNIGDLSNCKQVISIINFINDSMESKFKLN